MRPEKLVLFLDPGSERSALILWDTHNGIDGCRDLYIEKNEEISSIIWAVYANLLVIEEVQSYGMPVGKSIFDTVFWSGRFAEAMDGPFEMMPRRDVKLQLCGSSRAKDSNIRQAVIDIMGPAPTKKNPNPRWPSKPVKDLWAASAMALAWMQIRDEAEPRDTMRKAPELAAPRLP